MKIQHYKETFLAYLEGKNLKKEPANLYQPIEYILNLEGKRLRPVLTLMSCDLFGGKITEALNAALAIEMFHNFSLVHDDIMDGAPKRRGKPAVHKKWNVNTGILSGDAMLVLANQFLETYEGSLFKQLTVLFNKTAIEVCEGQQFDIDFETRNDVNIEQYIEMIRLKTAVLIGCSLQFGAIISKASVKDQTHIYNFGIYIGIAFQLQDDYLDVFGSIDVGKQKAGDIIENKKTFMFLKALELSDVNERRELLALYGQKKVSKTKIQTVISLFKKYQIPSIIKNEIMRFTNLALAHLNELSLAEDQKKVLKNFAVNLMNRRI